MLLNNCLFFCYIDILFPRLSKNAGFIRNENFDSQKLGYLPFLRYKCQIYSVMKWIILRERVHSKILISPIMIFFINLKNLSGNY